MFGGLFFRAEKYFYHASNRVLQGKCCRKSGPQLCRVPRHALAPIRDGVDGAIVGNVPRQDVGIAKSHPAELTLQGGGGGGSSRKKKADRNKRD